MGEEALRDSTSRLNGDIVQKPQFLIPHCKTLLRSGSSPLRRNFQTFWTRRSCVARQSNSIFCETNGQVWANTLPKQSRALGLLLPNPQWEKQNNLTHPKWLFTWPRCWMSTYSRVKQHVWAPLSRWMRLYTVLLSFCMSLKLSVQLLDSTLTEWSVLWPTARTRTDKTGRLAAGLCDASVWVGWNQRIHSVWMHWMKGTLCWDFPGSFAVR